MTHQAIDKIRAEMTSNANNGYVQVVGNFLLLHIEEHPEDAQHFVSPNKTILKSVDAMRKVAEKKKVGGVAVLTDAEGFAIVLNYFRSPEPAAEAPKQTAAAENTSKADKPKRERKPKPQPDPEPEDATDSDSAAEETDSEDEEEIDLDELLM